ncbi:MAG: dihydrofolate reductase family protein [Methanomassiliicoccales archaeon]|nr:dihydrofolate reductase family protein [Methanomassiliicoccales archaeon]
MNKVHVVLHTQVSVDSKADGFEYDMGTYYQLAETFKPDAVLSGAETMLKAEVPEEVPEWSYEVAKNFPSCGRTIMTIVDSKGRVRSWKALKKQPFWNSVLALCSESTPKEYLDYLKSENVDFIIAGKDHVDLRKALQEMRSRYGVKKVRIDSGGTLAGALLKDGLVDEISLLVSPFLLGNLSDNTFISADGLDLKAPLELKLKGVKKLDGGNIWVRYDVVGTK